MKIRSSRSQSLFHLKAYPLFPLAPSIFLCLYSSQLKVSVTLHMADGKMILLPKGRGRNGWRKINTQRGMRKGERTFSSSFLCFPPFAGLEYLSTLSNFCQSKAQFPFEELLFRLILILKSCKSVQSLTLPSFCLLSLYLIFVPVCLLQVSRFKCQLTKAAETPENLLIPKTTYKIPSFPDNTVVANFRRGFFSYQENWNWWLLTEVQVQEIPYLTVAVINCYLLLQSQQQSGVLQQD